MWRRWMPWVVAWGTACGSAGSAGTGAEGTGGTGAGTAQTGNASAVCGNGRLESGEGCDDGNEVDNDGCDADCVPTRVISVDGGMHHMCALMRTGTVTCWGRGTYGQLGYGDMETIGDDEIATASNVVDVGGTAVQVAAGGNHTCAVLDGGDVVCWGQGEKGRLGYGNKESIGDDEVPSSVGPVEVGEAVRWVDLGCEHTCALLETNEVLCWGAGGRSQLGGGMLEDVGDDEPASWGVRLSFPEVPTELTVGCSHACVLLASGQVYCWGDGHQGRLGYGSDEDIGDDELAPDAGPVPLDGVVVDVAAGDGHTCVLFDDGAVRCWGLGARGRLGLGSEANVGDDELPTDVSYVDTGFSPVGLMLGTGHTCGRSADGRVKCWGNNSHGQLGQGNEESIGDDELPSSVDFVRAGDVAEGWGGGDGVVCILTPSGRLRCWGMGLYGLLGQGNEQDVGDDELPEAVGNVPLF